MEMQCPGKYLKGIVEFLCSEELHDSIDKSWPVTDLLSLCYTLPRPGTLATQGRQFIPFWGSLLLKLCFCSFDVGILTTFCFSPKFASWSCAEPRPLLLSLVSGLRAEEQLYFHGWGSVLPNTSYFVSFFVSLSLEGVVFKYLKQFLAKFGGRKISVFVLILWLIGCVIWASYLNFPNLFSHLQNRLIIGNR